MTLKLACTNTPGKQLVNTNKVYLSPEDINDQVFLRVKELVFVAEPHPSIPKGHIALNKIQRQSAHVSASELLDCEIFQVPQDSFLLNTVTFGMYLIFCLIICAYLSCYAIRM
jgi:vesicle-fusing ATPase